MAAGEDAAAAAYPALSRYGLIGDCRTAALVSDEGSVDWLCLPRFDAASVFNRLLDRWSGGYLALACAGAARRRRYLPGTAVLETVFTARAGVARVYDFMPALAEEEKRGWLLPFWSLLKVVEGVEGEVAFDLVFRPRPGDGRRTPPLQARGPRAAACEAHGGLLRLDCDCDLRLGEGEARGQLVARAGGWRAVWLSYSQGPAVQPALSQSGALLDRTRRYWKGWSERCAYDGPGAPRVRRSALTLKLLSFAPSGAVIAAPTTSLPEKVGGVRNWDYRFCWLRDAAFCARAFYQLGCRAEADSFVEWLMYATTVTHPRLNVFYDIYGHRRVEEKELTALEGWRATGPVRVGNLAGAQRQLDVYGEVMESLELFDAAGGRLDRSMKEFVCGTAGFICSHWDFPDNGIWEMRRTPRHYVHSKVLCWRALEAAARLGERHGMREAPRWRACAERVRSAVLTAGWSQRLGSLRQCFGEDALDAALLLVPGTGLLPADSPQLRGTVDAVARELSCGEGLLRRYLVEDGLPPGEGAFLPCSYWLVEALALTGRRAEAERLFDALEVHGGSLGLLPEEIDCATGEGLGNYPQALSHVSLIRAALALKR